MRCMCCLFINVWFFFVVCYVVVVFKVVMILFEFKLILCIKNFSLEFSVFFGVGRFIARRFVLMVGKICFF